MDTHLSPLQHLSVWLDGGENDVNLLPHAMEWASRLDLPMRVVATAEGREHWHAKGAADRMKYWNCECANHGVALERFLLSPDVGATAVTQFLQPNGICALMQDARSATEDLLLRSARNRAVAVLLCSPVFEPLRRVMVLHHQNYHPTAYLESVARLCRRSAIEPIILIVADSETEAHLRQGYVEGVCHSFRLSADFDYVVGCDVRSAVSRAVAWRHCSHLIIERKQAPASWWQRGGDLLLQFRGVCDSLSILALPEEIGLEVRPHFFANKPLPIHETTNEPVGKLS